MAIVLSVFSVLSASVVDRGFEPRSGHAKHYAIRICCFSGMHTALWRTGKTGWLAKDRQYNGHKKNDN
jgi:hypothetical protein